ncbi:FYVE-domain-containing protein [Hesseltinella vesiculosa]|uniref:FYVE-domain-containing protein n=1 Tax=Hesseltinella vesiculosa TaxID=101127 RepID=A0A1X2G9E4_9FUNG|nr:FYVE-domain-containing protein [Hesseltinella vesiculosa]
MQHLDEPTFLLPRPIWVNDIDVNYCTGCNAPFGHFRRRHHCRHCGNIFCQECSSKNVILPQLGYGGKPMRVCNECFEVAYLVTYAISEEHGLPTQIHGARGLLELTERSDEKDLHSMAVHGGIDALIWLCTTSSSIDIHHLISTNLALLSEKESIRPVIITKCALPPLVLLLKRYIDQDHVKKSPTQSLHSNTSTTNGDDLLAHCNMSLEIVINCTHIIYQLARAGILSREEIITDGILDLLLHLCVYKVKTLQEETLETKSKDETPVSDIHLSCQWQERESVICTLAAKSISFISSTVANQPSIIERLQASGSLAQVLLSSNQDVKKYMAKAVAYLSLRNDRYKSTLLKNDRVQALLSILVQLPQRNQLKKKDRKSDLTHYGSVVECHLSESLESPHSSYIAAVSHTCCALANFATNAESQAILMSQPRFIRYLCNGASMLTSHQEIQRHVARCLANLALYDDNHNHMLTDDLADNCYNVIPTLISIGKSHLSNNDTLRHIIRALDNLTTKVEDGATEKEMWQGHTYTMKPFLASVQQASDDDDVMKRCQNITQRFQSIGL